MNGEHTWSEIQSQGHVWQAAVSRASEASGPLAEHYRSKQYTEALFIGCGSTHYLSLSAAALASEMLGLRARGLPSSEIFLFPKAVLPRSGQPVLVAVSRSGETSETIMAVDLFKSSYGNETLTVGNYPDARLVKACAASIVIPEGQEISVAQTRSFASMLVAIQVLVGTCAGDRAYLEAVSALPAAVARLLRDYTEPMRKLGADDAYDKYIFLGSGPFFGVASEGMLKMKEMSLSHSEAFHYMEFRHGPKSIVDKRTLILGLLSDSARDQELKVLSEMRGLGASVLLIADRIPAGAPADYTVELGTGLPELARLPLCLTPLQVLAFSRSVSKGLDPDNPTNLTQVVVL